MKVSFVWPSPKSSKVITSYTSSMASCSIPYSAGSTVFFVISDLLFLHLIYNYIQFVETLFPESAIANHPVADCLNRLWPKRAHTLSSTLRLDHHPRPHQVGANRSQSEDRR